MQKKNTKASELKRFYKTVGIEVMVSNTVYKIVIKSFLDQWKGLTNCKKHTQPVVPKITAELFVIHWTDVFDDFLVRKIGVRTIPLSYVTRLTALATRPMSVHKADLLQGEAYGSMEEELVAQSSHTHTHTHTHTLYCEDNTAVYFYLEEAVNCVPAPLPSLHLPALPTGIHLIYFQIGSPDIFPAHYYFIQDSLILVI
eukprot:1811893-Ditylum_brightwellii.AAC.1